MAGALHALETDPRLAGWLAEAAEGAVGTAAVNVAEAMRVHARAVLVLAPLASEIARVSVEGETVWAAARGASDFAAFAPVLARIVALKREEAACLAGRRRALRRAARRLRAGNDGGEVAATFDRLRRPRPRCASGSPGAAAAGAARGRLSRRTASWLCAADGRLFGYDWAAGRLDLAVHPSSTGTGGDVRITTRVDAADPFQCLFATIHEVGHAVYEQGLDPDLAFQPVGADASMGVHESQSRLFENHFGRSRAFCGLAGPGDERPGLRRPLRTPRRSTTAVNVVAPGFIRIDADEVHYNLHVMLRFDLERALLEGGLEVARPPRRRGTRASWPTSGSAGAGRPRRRAAGRALGVGGLRLLPDLHPRHALRRRARRGRSAATSTSMPVSPRATSSRDRRLNQHIHRHGRLVRRGA